MLLALFDIVDLLLQVLMWIIIIQAILSWLVAFNVINTHNDFVRSLPQRARSDDRAALPADPQDPARFRRPRFLADRGPPADLSCCASCSGGARARSRLRWATVTAALIDGKAFAAGLRARVAAAVPAFVGAAGRTPGLAVVLVGEDPASQVYVRSKGKATIAAGMASFEHRLPADTRQAELLALVERLNADDGGRRHPRPAAAARRRSTRRR